MCLEHKTADNMGLPRMSGKFFPPASPDGHGWTKQTLFRRRVDCLQAAILPALPRCQDGNERPSRAERK